MTKSPISYSQYDTPTDVLVDKSLSHDEKVKILKCWCEDEEALIRAASEGLGGGERPHLKQAQLALETLNTPD